ncbi:PREDICTED: small kinetochore-associated protein isoform X2 [Chinchilla lanigera]|uniref:small kinetochore-associated protein isoform X2 n=1 Tax=Chinchilla lanigera TaxID=34839 RepID=UPI000696A4DF|nr:PREDICTED: small kinetochore-associated protein isoform X2 [Chinchilla lanigera]
MAAPGAAARDIDFRTTGPPTEREPRPLPPGHRTFPFKTEAAEPACNLTVAVEHFLNLSDKECGPERAQPCRLATMTSVAKTVDSVQPPAVASGGPPADTKTLATSKSLLPVKSKKVITSRSLHSNSDIMKVTKPKQENGQMQVAEPSSKRNIRKSCKPLREQKSEEELKDKNQLLETANKQLHQKLIKTQGELKDLTQKVELLEKFRDNCLAILESKGLNPGSDTLASQQEPATDHEDSVLLLETLQDELKLFNETAKKQLEELQALKIGQLS